MSQTVSEVETKIREIQNGINQAARDMGPALQSAVDKIFGEWYVPDFLKDRALRKAREASAEFNKVPPKVDPTVEIILREINDYRALSQTAPQYCSVSFDEAAASVAYDQLGPNGDDWQSGNTQAYRGAVHALPAKLQNLRDAVEEICDLLTDLKEDYDSFFTGLLVAVISLSLAIAGLLAAIAGLIAAIPSGGAGLVISIVGLVVAVLSLVVAAIAFATLPDMDQARATTAERLRNAATSVRNSRWPNKPAIGSGGW